MEPLWAGGWKWRMTLSFNLVKEFASIPIQASKIQKRLVTMKMMRPRMNSRIRVVSLIKHNQMLQKTKHQIGPLSWFLWRKALRFQKRRIIIMFVILMDKIFVLVWWQPKWSWILIRIMETCESLICMIQIPLKSTIKILKETLPLMKKVWNS